MKSKSLTTLFLVIAAVAAPDLRSQTQPDTRVLPFQGRLTDADGNPVADGARVVQFKIYDAPVGGRAVWNGEVHNLTVNGGLVSTLLGTRASLSGVNFNLDLYLEVTIDANADGEISLADPPLLPRQSIVPAVFAKESANSQLLDGYDWTALFGTNNPAEGALLASKIGDESLTTAKLRDGAVNTAKIADGAVTRPKLDTKGASAGQALIYNGTEVVWDQINAVSAETAANAQKLNGFDWASLFSDGNPQSGTLSAAHIVSRGNLHVVGDTTHSGRAVFNGPSVVIAGSLLAPAIGINTFLGDWGLYLRGVGDFNHYIKWGNALGTARDFDGPEIVGNGGGVLGTVGNWSLRWNWNGTVQSRGTFHNGSDRNIKENFTPLDPGDILDKVLSLPVTRWNYKDDPHAQHIGPVSQDFHAAFAVGSDDRFIATVDADGVALAAIQGLHQRLVEQHNEMRELVAAQQRLIDDLKAELAALRNAR